MADFDDFFRRATAKRPYPYQARLAAAGTIPDVIDLPTGSGKTAAAVISVWLWGRVSGRRDVPRRLVYCLPRRSLVEQTVGRVGRWVENLGLEDRIGVSQIMGGDSQWDVETEPEREYILVGTQDMLLSGALNRSYGKGYRVWPMHFALLNNDCLWVMDEVQIMENGLPTSRQLDVMRRWFGTYGPHHTIWMSATINERWLETPDSTRPERVFRLVDGEMSGGDLGRRNTACKTVRRANIEGGQYGSETVRRLLEMHHPGTPTTIMVNTVGRAQDIYAEIKKTGVPCMLVHSRFRAAERLAINKRISKIGKDDDIIIVSTQVLEAGVDLSVRTLVTELAPWASMVQRFGRCNRGAEFGRADIIWLDVPEGKIEPYAKNQMDESREMLSLLEGRSASPATLPKQDGDMLFDSVLRRRDVTDLFDTAQDLSGGRTDPSRFVRSLERSLDVDVLWRADDKESAPHDPEVCSIPLSDARRFIKKVGAMVFDHTTDRWVETDDVLPSQTIMLDCSSGGYSPEIGWQVGLRDNVAAVAPNRGGGGAEHEPVAVTLDDHTEHVVAEAGRLVAGLDMLENGHADAVVEAARHHDIGKVHPVFQHTMINNGCADDGTVWAKSPRRVGRYARPGFRHEAASALAYLVHHPNEYLTAYLIAAHHGVVRLSMRSVHPDDTRLLGLEPSDRLPAYGGRAVSLPETELDLSPANLGRDGGPSWADAATRLLDRHGPFRLAYLEMVVMAADRVASRKEDGGAYVA